MDYSFLNSLTLSELEMLKQSLTKEDDCKLLLSEIEKMEYYKKLGFFEFSSDRLPNYREQNEQYYLGLAKQITLRDIPFLCDSLNARKVNYFPIPKFYLEDNESLYDVENWFNVARHRYDREGGYNTYNYIKNYIYSLLLGDASISKEDVFQQYVEKCLLAKERIVEIASYLYEYLKNVDSLHLSIGRQGIANTTRRTNNSRPLSPYQERLVKAVAFGTSYEKLEARNYEDCKRLLFVR